MADDLLLQALYGDLAQKAANDPWLQGGKAVLAERPQYRGYGSPWAGLGASFAQALLGSGMQSYGQQEQAADKSRLTAALLDAASQPDETAALKANPELAQYAPYAAYEKRAKERAIEDEKAKALAMGKLSQTFNTDTGKMEFVPGALENFRQLESIKNQYRPAREGEAPVPAAFQPMVAKSVMGDPLTQEETAIVSQAPKWILDTIRQNYAMNQLQDRAGNNFELKKGAQERTNRQLDLGIYKPYAENVPLPTAGEAAKLRGKVGAVSAVAHDIDMIAKNPQYKLTGEEAISNRAYSGIIFNQLRNYTASGANLTKNEEEQLNKLIIPTLANGQPLATVFATLTGRDKATAAQAIKKALWGTLDAELATYGHVRAGAELTPETKIMLEQSYGVPSGQTKTIGGKTYRKTDKGWEAIQ